MARYVTRPQVKAYRPMICEDEWYTDPLVPHLSVDDHDAVFTGLLDAKGEEIWRAPNPMGFGNDQDW